MIFNFSNQSWDKLVDSIHPITASPAALKMASIASLLLMFSGLAQAQSQLAFPSAEGFGRFAEGGRGGKVIRVTNLNDSGGGSFRACATASGPRTCVFDVGGTIRLQSKLEIRNPYLTIAGQTAPGDGIQIRNASIQVRTNDVIIRHLRLRSGENVPEPTKGSSISLFTSSAKDIIIDHVSASWHTDENTSIWDRASNATFQWMIVSEGLHCTGASSSEPCHSKGLLSGKISTRYSILNSLFAHNEDRNPFIKDGDVEMVNNVIYNYGPDAAATAIVPTEAKMRINLIGNYYLPGRNSHNNRPVRPPIGGAYTQGSTIYASGNLHPRYRPNNSYSEKAIFKADPGSTWTNSRHSFPTTNAVSADNALNRVLSRAGATEPRRDSVDSRVVNDVRNGTGRIIDSESQVGGFPNFASAKRSSSFDSDNDGIADAWESAHGLNPSNSSDAQSFHANGYTHLENYLNELAGDSVPGLGSTQTKTPKPPTELRAN